MTERGAPKLSDCILSILFLSAKGPATMTGPFVHDQALAPQAGAPVSFSHQQRAVKENNFARRGGILIAT
jgi:hypothetical protein